MSCVKTVLASLMILLTTASACHIRAAEVPLSERAKIEVLIKSVETLTDATFIRNGSKYDAKTAARFLRAKWKAHENEIKTARDFIEREASTSSMSGKSYLIRFKNDREVKCGEYLKGQLLLLEK